MLYVRSGKVIVATLTVEYAIADSCASTIDLQSDNISPNRDGRFRRQLRPSSISMLSRPGCILEFQSSHEVLGHRWTLEFFLKARTNTATFEPGRQLDRFTI